MANKVLAKKIEKKEKEVAVFDEKIAEFELQKKERVQELKGLYALREREEKLIAEMEKINMEVSEK